MLSLKIRVIIIKPAQQSNKSHHTLPGTAIDSIAEQNNKAALLSTADTLAMAHIFGKIWDNGDFLYIKSIYLCHMMPYEIFFKTVIMAGIWNAYLFLLSLFPNVFKTWNELSVLDFSQIVPAVIHLSSIYSLNTYYATWGSTEINENKPDKAPALNEAEGIIKSS